MLLLNYANISSRNYRSSDESYVGNSVWNDNGHIYVCIILLVLIVKTRHYSNVCTRSFQKQTRNSRKIETISRFSGLYYKPHRHLICCVLCFFWSVFCTLVEPSRENGSKTKQKKYRYSYISDIASFCGSSIIFNFHFQQYLACFVLGNSQELLFVPPWQRSLRLM